MQSARKNFTRNVKIVNVRAATYNITRPCRENNFLTRLQIRREFSRCLKCLYRASCGKMETKKKKEIRMKRK